MKPGAKPKPKCLIESRAWAQNGLAFKIAATEIQNRYSHRTNKTVKCEIQEVVKLWPDNSLPTNAGWLDAVPPSSVRVARRQWLGLSTWGAFEREYRIMRFTLDVGQSNKSLRSVSPQLVHGAMRLFGCPMSCNHSHAFAWALILLFNGVVLRIFHWQQRRTRLCFEQERPLLFAGLRPHTYRVFVDGQLGSQHSGF